jgi:hypothetical protein
MSLQNWVDKTPDLSWLCWVTSGKNQGISVKKWGLTRFFRNIFYRDRKFLPSEFFNHKILSKKYRLNRKISWDAWLNQQRMDRPMSLETPVFRNVFRKIRDECIWYNESYDHFCQEMPRSIACDTRILNSLSICSVTFCQELSHETYVHYESRILKRWP